MGNFVFNAALGKTHAYAENVENNNPVAAVLRQFVLNVTGTQDALMRDVDTMAALLALANVAEVTNTNYVNTPLDETDIIITIDDTNDQVDIQVGDQTYTAIAAGDAWSDVVIAYDPDGTDTDTGTIPLTLHDFIVTPNGGDIIVDEPVTGFWRGTSAT